jgi:hypothetical protein
VGRSARSSGGMNIISEHAGHADILREPIDGTIGD